MKKVIFVFAIAAAFAACNNGGESTENKVDSVASEAKAAVDSVAAKADSTVSAVADSAKAAVDSTAKKVDSAAKH